MDEKLFETTKTALDRELDELDKDASVGIMLGWNLYTEFRERQLLKPKLADMILTKWMLPSYRDKIVADAFDIPDDEYRVGRPKPER
jgi:hypothetical protein